jgi:putative nucleotidyltransferase with HDIG domain
LITAKPLSEEVVDPSARLAQVERTWALGVHDVAEVVIDPSVRAIIDESLSGEKLQLPIMPEASAMLMSMTTDDETRIQDLVDVIQRDPSLAAHLLRIANSPLYAPRYPSVSLRHAVARLGALELRRVAITIGCQARVFNVGGWENEVHQLFAHSLTTALYASEVAKLVRANEEEAFLCGLLHDVGHAIVLQGLEDLKKKHKVELSRAAIITIAGEYHTLIGRRLIEQWGLSPRLADIVALHHDEVRAPAMNLALVKVADALAYGLREPPPKSDDDTIVDSLGLTPAAVGELASKRRQFVALAAALM